MKSLRKRATTQQSGESVKQRERDDAAHAEPMPPSESQHAEPKRKGGAPKGNQNRTTHGRYRAVKGAKRRTPVNVDEHDAIARRRARVVYRGLEEEWQAERRTYGEDLAAELRLEAKGKLRGFTTAKGEVKDLLRILMQLRERRSNREREVREYWLELRGKKGGKLTLAQLVEGSYEETHVYRATFHDGTPITGDGSGIPDLTPAASPMPSLDRKVSPVEPTAVRVPRVAEEPAPRPSSLNLSPELREWAMALDLDDDE